MKKKILNYWPYFILLLVSLFPFWINISTFSPEGIFNLRDFNVPFDVLANFKQMLSVWNPNLGFGYPNFSGNLVLIYHLPLLLFKIIGFSLLNSEKLYLSLVLFFVGFGGYLFLYNYFIFPNTEFRKIASLAGALFYMFNIPLNQRFIGVPHTAISIALFPVLLICLDKIISKNKEKSRLILVLLIPFIITFSLASDLSLSYLFFLSAGIFLIVTIFRHRNSILIKNIISDGVIIVIFSLLLNCFWTLPIIGDSLSGKGYLSDIVDTNYNQRVFNKNYFYHDSPLDVLRLHWGKDSFDSISLAKENYYPSIVRNYYHLPISTLSFLALIVFGIWRSFKSRENKKQVLTVTLLGVIGFLFSFGGKSPLGFWKIHELLFKYFPGFTVLRTFLKFQFLIVLWYSCLIYFIAYNLIAKFSNGILKKIFLIIVYVFFIVQGSLPWFLTNLAGRLEFFLLPDYYWQAKKWLDDQGSNFRFIIFPQGEWTETYEWGPKFELVPIYRNFFTQPSLYQEPEDATGGKLLVDPISNFEISNLSKYLKFLGVKYALVRKDISPTSVYPQFNYILENMSGCLEANGYKLIKSFGKKLFFYEYESGSPLSEIYIPEKIKYFSGSKNEVKYLFNRQESDERIAILSEENDLNKEAIALSSNDYFSARLIASDSAYTVDLPQKRDYQLFLRPSLTDHLIDYKKSSFFDKNFFVVNKELNEFPVLSMKDFWWDYGSLNLNTGKNDFKIDSQRVNLASDDGWKTQNSQDGKETFLVQQINGWTPGYSYRVTFDYLTDDKGIDFAIVEQKYKMTKEMYEYTSWQEQLVNDRLVTNGGWKKYDRTVISSSEAVAAGAIIGNANSGTKIINLIISPIFKPMVFLQSTANAQVAKPPDIEFKKINPTKFEVNIKNVTQPFILVLNDSFNKNWTAKINNKIIAKKNHLIVNGFANGWYLNQEDFSEGSGKIILNFYPQKLFVLGIWISLGTAVFMIGIILIIFLKKKYAKNDEII